MAAQESFLVVRLLSVRLWPLLLELAREFYFWYLWSQKHEAPWLLPLELPPPLCEKSRL